MEQTSNKTQANTLPKITSIKDAGLIKVFSIILFFLNLTNEKSKIR